MKEHTDIKPEGAEVQSGRNYGRRTNSKKHANNSYVDDILRGVRFNTGKEGPELYARTIERLGLYAGTQFKNGADVKKCLMAGR